MLLKIKQLEEESQITRATQAEDDQYEMNVRASNIVNILFIVHKKPNKANNVLTY